MSSPARAPFIAITVTAALAACTGPRVAIETQEAFASTGTYSRTYAALDAQACEAARRALLSQGYVISAAANDQVRGKKNFQPEPQLHAQVEVTVVCAREGYAGRRTIAFVNAVQDTFTLRKSNSSASVGVSPFGSLSLPFSGSDEALVKVASATVTNGPFYERFFQLLERYLAGDAGQLLPMPGEAPSPSPSPAPARPASSPPASPVPAAPASAAG